MPNDTNVEQLILNRLTKTQYDEAINQGQINPNELYLVRDEDILAAEVRYDNKDSGLKADDVQGAIDEIVGNPINIDKVSDLRSELDNRVKFPASGTGLIGQQMVSDGAGGVMWMDSKPESWENIAAAVRVGAGSRLYPVGYEFTTRNSETNKDIVWVVRGHDNWVPMDKSIQHTMTLEAKYVYSDASGNRKGVVFDETEAFYYAENGLAPGQYNITIAEQAWCTSDNGKTYQFTLSKEVPQGGQLVFNMTYNQPLEGKTVMSYGAIGSTEVIESAGITEGAGGTNLGTTDGKSNNVNHMHRAIFGSNNYAQSAVRQLLNSDQKAGHVWAPTNKFDRPPSWAQSYTGILSILPKDFVDAIVIPDIPCRTNGVYEIDSLDGGMFTPNQVYTLNDKITLLSRPEIYGSWDSESLKDGTVLEYYDGVTNAERIKRDESGTAHYTWLRSPSPWGAGNAGIVKPDGDCLSNGAGHGYGVAFACAIG